MLDIDIVLILLLAGSAAGLLAGLFGVGGGVIVIPVTLWVLGMQDIGSDCLSSAMSGTQVA